MPFPEDDAEVELLVREAIAVKALGVEGIGHVFTEPFYVSGKIQYAEKLGIENPEGVEVRCLFIDFLGFVDTDRGCDDNPHYMLRYKLRDVQEFVPVRPGGGSSNADFIALCFRLRRTFLAGKDLGWPDRLYSERLVVLTEAELGDDPYTQAFAHAIDFLLEVEVSPLDVDV